MVYEVGTRVRVIIADTSDPDHDCHGKTGVIRDVYEDDLGALLGDPRERFIYTVDLDELGERPFRQHELEVM